VRGFSGKEGTGGGEVDCKKPGNPRVPLVDLRVGQGGPEKREPAGLPGLAGGRSPPSFFKKKNVFLLLFSCLLTKPFQIVFI
jgi:hypothetical protein